MDLIILCTYVKDEIKMGTQKFNADFFSQIDRVLNFELNFFPTTAHDDA